MERLTMRGSKADETVSAFAMLRRDKAVAIVASLPVPR